ncbi:MAG: hypothetical protein MjAS7_0067 [Metallosphaera javensis (ex Sakai et al. 2022)]|nr:MAG: hypothetical protein MjAS7_0011 [Metallosphaera javensis (ex Sakai et al. 2022)]BCS91459.1 MAG: hypothetical protein MjAS7_0067 [Metallosphaera javensis (ex Sakai et al. 2022)]
MVMEGRRIEYRLRWMSVRLPAYDGKGRVRTEVERELLRGEEEAVLRNSRSTRCWEGR